MTRYIRKTTKTATIAASGTTSDAVDLSEHTLAAVIIPASVGTSFSFQVSVDGTNFFALNDTSDAAITVTKTAGSSTAHPLQANDFAGFTHLKVVSGSTETGGLAVTCVLYMV